MCVGTVVSGIGGVEGLKPEKCCSKCSVAKKDRFESAVGITIQGAKKEGEVVFVKMVRTRCRWLVMEYRLLTEVLAV